MTDSLSPWGAHKKVLETEWFEDAARGVKDTYVYRYFDADGRLLYVGQTIDVAKRHSGHKSRSPWFRAVARRVVDGPFPKQLALGHEFFVIHRDGPLHNAHKANGYRGPGSLPWDIAMGEEFQRRLETEPGFWRRESEWMAERMGGEHFTDELIDRMRSHEQRAAS